MFFAVRFQQAADVARGEQLTFARLAGLSHEMSALEWRAMAERGVDPELAASAEGARQALSRTLEQLPDEGGK